MLKGFLSGAMALAIADFSHAGVMLQPAVATTNMGWFNTFQPIYAIDKSGLAAPYTSGVTDFDAFVPVTGTVNGGASFTTWFSSSGNITGNFDFDLGGSHSIGSFALWADPQATPNQGIKDFSLFADDNAAFSSPELLGTFTAVDGIPNPTNFGQIFEFDPTIASHVRMQILSNHGSTLTTGMVEAAFEIVEAAPPCPGDVGGGGSGGNGIVDVDDLLSIINAWGPCANCAKCPADITGNCTVDVDDLLNVINGWGPCK